MLQLSDACAGLLINVTEVNATEGPRLVGKVNLSNPSTQAINLVNVTYSLFPNTPVAPLFGLVNCTGTKENAVSIAASKSLACTFSANLTLPFSNWSSIGITANVPSEWLPAPPPLAPPSQTTPCQPAPCALHSTRTRRLRSCRALATPPPCSRTHCPAKLLQGGPAVPLPAGGVPPPARFPEPRPHPVHPACPLQPLSAPATCCPCPPA